jgi:hypothetical protein
MEGFNTNFTIYDRKKLDNIESNANNYVLPDDVVQDDTYVKTDNNFTDDNKDKLDNIESNANNYVLPDDVVQDDTYVKTDNNFTDDNKDKLDNIESNANNYVLPDDVVQDDTYVKTDNNFTDFYRDRLGGENGVYTYDSELKYVEVSYNSNSTNYYTIGKLVFVEFFVDVDTLDTDDGSWFHLKMPLDILHDDSVIGTVLNYDEDDRLINFTEIPSFGNNTSNVFINRGNGKRYKYNDSEVNTSGILKVSLIYVKK